MRNAAKARFSSLISKALSSSTLFRLQPTGGVPATRMGACALQHGEVPEACVGECCGFCAPTPFVWLERDTDFGDLLVYGRAAVCMARVCAWVSVSICVCAALFIFFPVDNFYTRNSFFAFYFRENGRRGLRKILCIRARRYARMQQRMSRRAST
jgi:hypothetical protein